MIRVYSGNQCKGDGIMPPQMNCKEKFKNCRQIAIAGKYRDISIATYDPMEVEAIDMFTTAIGTEIRYFLHEENDIKEIEGDLLSEIYCAVGEIYEEIDATKMAIDLGLQDGYGEKFCR